MIPKDPMILLSYVNTQLRDYYDSLEALCTCRGLKKDELVAKMHSIDYEYDEEPISSYKKYVKCSLTAGIAVGEHFSYCI